MRYMLEELVMDLILEELVYHHVVSVALEEL
jgi:hypothetical protein